jgi:hypothetical protein
MAQPPPVHVEVAWGSAHARPQAPQWASEPARLVSQPLAGFASQSPNPVAHAATAQAPLTQAAVALASEHARPQPPQCETAARVLVSQPLAGFESQSPNPAAQAKAHTPAAHEGVALAGDGQALPQRPQWASEVARLAHEPAQLVSPAAQVERHAPAEHTSPAAHARPHAPQWARSLWVLTSQPVEAIASQSPKPALQV